MNRDKYNSLSKTILDACIAVHSEMGPGLLESVYELCLMKEFKLREIHAKNQVSIPLYYKGFELSKEYKIDILVENEIIIEIQASEAMLPVH